MPHHQQQAKTHLFVLVQAKITLVSPGGTTLAMQKSILKK